MECHDEEARLRYMVWDDVYLTERPYQHYRPGIPEGDPRTSNIVFREGNPEKIRDARGQEADFTLDLHGFAFRTMNSALTEGCFSPLLVQAEYLPEVKELLGEVLGEIDHVTFFDWKVCLFHPRELACKMLTQARRCVRARLIPGIRQSTDSGDQFSTPGRQYKFTSVRFPGPH